MKKIKLILINLIFMAILILSIILGDKESTNFSYILGILSGVWSVVIFYTIMQFRNKKQIEKIYDERQIINRGKCYETAFFALITLLILDGYVRIMFDINWSTYIIGVFTMIIISLTVFTTLAIKKDAYQAINMNTKSISILSLIVSIFNFLSFITGTIEKGFLVNNQVTNYFLNLITGLFTLVILIALVVKQHKEKDIYEES